MIAIFVAFEELGAPSASNSPTLLNRITTQIDEFLTPKADNTPQPQEEQSSSETTEEPSEQSPLATQENRGAAPAEQSVDQQ